MHCVPCKYQFHYASPQHFDHQIQRETFTKRSLDGLLDKAKKCKEQIRTDLSHLVPHLMNVTLIS